MELLSQDNPFPFDLWPLEIDQQAQGPSGRAKIVQTLGQVIVVQSIHAFQFDHESAFDEDIREVLSNRLAFVANAERDFGSSGYTSEPQFGKKSSRVDLFKEASTKRIRNLEYRVEDSPGQGI